MSSTRSRMIAAAACLHLGAAAGIFLLSHFAVVPSVFNPRGVGLTFAADGQVYLASAQSLVEVLRRDGPAAWAAAPFPLHLKIYSLSFAPLSPLFGFHAVGAEPVNLACYVVTLTLVYKLGSEVFEPRAGILAAGVVGLWPSFLLHTTQLLKDPLFVAATLALVFLNLRWLTRDYGPAGGLAGGAGAAALCAFLWLIRGEVWELTLAVAVIGGALALGRQLLRGKLRSWNTAGAILMLLLAVNVPPLLRRAGVNDSSRLSAAGGTRSPGPGAGAWAEGAAASGRSGALERVKERAGGLVSKVGAMRGRFIAEYPGAGSNVDADVTFSDAASLARHLPRAAAVGFFAPFPSMWLGPGVQAGRAGRLVSGAETAFMYLVEALALVGLWHARRRPSAWLLFLVAAAGLVALGLVVVNVGALYRMRYAFWMLLIVLGGGGAARLSGVLSGGGPAPVRRWAASRAGRAVRIRPGVTPTR